MKASALTISLILILVPLTGCAGSDGEVNVDLTTEEIQDLIDDNIDDFLNNTTVTVNQENHNNNTTNSQTIVNHNNYTTIEQPSSLKSKSGTMPGLTYVDNAPLGPAVLVREDRFAAAAAGNSATGLDGANICVGIGTDLEWNMQQWFSANEIDFTSVPVADTAEATAKFIDGSCDAMTFVSGLLAHEKKAQLDSDGSMGGVDIWVDVRYSDSPGVPFQVANSLSVIVEQGGDEMISGFVYILTQVDLIGTCPENSSNTSGCEDFSITLQNDLEGVYLETSCSNGVSNSWSIQHDLDGSLLGALSEALIGFGLDCTHALNFYITHVIEDLPSSTDYDMHEHDLSWSDWVYSIVWETRSIEQVN
jgi:hypothetical protein